VWELDDLFVAPRHMRRGFATKLIEDLVGGAAEQGVDHIQVTANPHAMQFYRFVGFVDEGVAETQFGPAPLLRLNIPRF
jgi:GNAT superfamily N-acetyltransferase